MSRQQIEQVVESIQVWNVTEAQRYKDGVLLEEYRHDPLSSASGRAMVPAESYYALLYAIDDERLDLREIIREELKAHGLRYDPAWRGKA